MAGIFGEFFLVSVAHETKHEKSSKIRGKFGAKFGAKFGTKIRKIRELSFCNFPDLTMFYGHCGSRQVSRSRASLLRPCWSSGLLSEAMILVHQNRTIAIAIDFRVDGAKIARNPAERCPSFPWLFGFPWLTLSKEFPCLNSYFPRFSWVRSEQKILGKFEGFSLIKPNNQGKEGHGGVLGSEIAA